MSSVVHRPGSLAAELQGQSALQSIQWKVSQSNLNLVATREALERHGVRIQEGLEGIDRTLTEGVITLHADLMSIEGAVNDLTAKFDWGIARLEAGIGGLIRLAKTPEQTWAIEQYDIACDAFDRALYPESLEHIERAINGFEGHTGYKLERSFHHRLGMILRADSEVQDLAKAEDAYLTAARYAGERHRFDAALALAAAGHVAYQQGKVDDALAHTQRALTFADISEVKFQMARILMHQHKVESALAYLDKAVEADALYSVKCLDRREIDFLAHEQDVRSAITAWRDVLAEKCRVMGTASDAALLDLTSVARVSAETIESSMKTLIRGGRFNTLRSMNLIVPESSATWPFLITTGEGRYLDVRNAYERREEARDAVAGYGQRVANMLEPVLSALQSDIKSVSADNPFSMSIASLAVLALGIFLPVAILFYLIGHPTTASQWAFYVMLTLFATGAIMLPIVGAMRELRVYQAGKELITHLQQVRASIEEKYQNLASVFLMVGSRSPHTPEKGT